MAGLNRILVLSPVKTDTLIMPWTDASLMQGGVYSEVYSLNNLVSVCFMRFITSLLNGTGCSHEGCGQFPVFSDVATTH